MRNGFPAAHPGPAALAWTLGLIGAVASVLPAFAGAMGPTEYLEGPRAQAPAMPGLAAPRSLSWSVGLLSGSVKPDADLADYQWDTAPRAGLGLQVFAGRGPWSAGARLWSAQTVQRIGLPSTLAGPHVRWTSWELIGRCRLATLWGNELLASAAGGRVRLDYSPDRMSVDAGGGGTPVVVEFKPVEEWILGGGVSLRRPVARALSLGLEADHRVFRLDTAHRNGSVIEMQRQSFGDWSARCELAWLHGQP